MKLVIVCASCFLLAAACDNSSAQLQAQQLQQQQQTADQANTQKCADQAATFRAALPPAQQDANVVNHYNKKQNKCFVETDTSYFESASNDYETDVYDAYENKLYLICFVTYPYSGTTPGVKFCRDQGQSFPYDQKQIHIDSYMTD